MDEFKQVFDSLQSILQPYAKDMDVVVDAPDEIYLNTRFIMKNKKPLYFSSVKIKKNYVSYHLMPVYESPALLEGLSPELMKRMQGKSCFNFKAADEALFAELATLTRQGFESYQAQGYLES